MIPGIVAGQASAYAPPEPTYVVSMDFEGANGSATFTDDGTGASTWARSGTGVALTTTTPLAGTSSLLVTATTDYLETDYDSDNCLPASADWDISFKMRAATLVSGGLGRYVLSAQDSSTTAAGTAFAIATNASGNLLLVLSDGTTRSVIVTSSTVLSVDTTYDVLMQRRGTSVRMFFGGISVGTGTFSGSVNLPASRKLRIGKPEASASSASSLRFDTFRIARY